MTVLTSSLSRHAEAVVRPRRAGRLRAGRAQHTRPISARRRGRRSGERGTPSPTTRGSIFLVGDLLRKISARLRRRRESSVASAPGEFRCVQRGPTPEDPTPGAGWGVVSGRGGPAVHAAVCGSFLVDALRPGSAKAACTSAFTCHGRRHTHRGRVALRRRRHGGAETPPLPRADRGAV